MNEPSRAVGELLASRVAAAGLTLDGAVADLLEQYFRLLAHWNKRINLTALPLENPTESALDRLFIESLVAADSVLAGAVSWVDLGSGGGSPAIPMKILKPAVTLIMVESKSRKAAFLREAVRELGLEGASVAELRFEEFSRDATMRESADVVTLRAVRPDQTAFGTAGNLLRPSGRLALFTSSDAPQSSISGDFAVAETMKLTATAGLAIYRRRNVPRGTC